MLTVKAKHATMLLTVSEVEGLSDGMDELSDEELPSAVPAASKQLPAHPSVVMVSGKAFFGHIHSHPDSYPHPSSVSVPTICFLSGIQGTSGVLWGPFGVFIGCLQFMTQ